jgi:predicted acylesterase/phospholipase RssA
MKIDTLVLSGGGPSAIAYIGIFQGLFENNILQKDLNNIKEIITTSAGIFFSFLLLLKIDIKVIYHLIDQFHISSILKNDNISINDLLIDFGIFSNHKIKEMFQSVIKNKMNKSDLTLRELYDLTKIKLTVKVFNVTMKRLEYISYKTDPDLSISTLGMMTTAIPGIFKPVIYNEYKYVDGGLRGHYPIEKCKSKNYLGIVIIGGTINPGSSQIIKLFPILEYIYSLMINQDEIFYKKSQYHKKTIISDINLGCDFNVSKETYLKVIERGYTDCIKFIERKNL